MCSTSLKFSIVFTAIPFNVSASVVIVVLKRRMVLIWFHLVNRKNWVFTQYLDQPHNLHFATLPTDVSYIVYQEEECPRTKRRHYQGYIQLAKRKYMSFLKRLISSNVHLEVQRASNTDDARAYCMKEATRVAGPWELGEYIKFKPERTDIVRFKDAILSGASEESLWHDFTHNMARNKSMFHTLYTYGTTSAVPRVLTRKPDPPIVTVLIGAPRSGKTRHVYDAHGPEDLFAVPFTEGFKWYDGYAQQEAALFDEFTGNMSLSRLLQATDRYPRTVESKGSVLLWGPPKYIYFTSNLDPRDWYETFLYRKDGSVRRDRTLQLLALFKRFSFVFRFPGSDGARYDIVTDEYV